MKNYFFYGIIEFIYRKTFCHHVREGLKIYLRINCLILLQFYMTTRFAVISKNKIKLMCLSCIVEYNFYKHSKFCSFS